MTRALLLLVLLAGCDPRTDWRYTLPSDLKKSEARILAHMDYIAQADPTTEADWLGQHPSQYRIHKWRGYRYVPGIVLPLHNATGLALVVQDSVSACLLRAGETREWTPGGGPIEITAPGGYDAPAESTVTHTGPLPSPGR